MIFYNDVLLDKEECEFILNSNLEWYESGFTIKIGDTYTQKNVVDNRKRKSIQSDFHLEKGSHLFDKFNNLFNKLGYVLKKDKINCTIIKYTEGCFIYKHKDDYDSRLFTCAVQLNDSKDYIGGDYKYWIDDKEYIMNRKQGTCMIYSPETDHKVEVIERGERNSFIIFLHSTDIITSKPSLI